MIKYRNAKLDDMKEIAKVHLLTQPEYFTSTLGVELLEKFYTEFLIEDNLFVLAYDDKTNKTVGFCMGHYYGSRAEKKWEQKYKIKIIRRLIFKCIQLNKLALSRSFGRIKGVVFKKSRSNKSIDYFWHLLSMGVLEEYRGQHIGSTLIDKFEERCLLNPANKNSEGSVACTIGAYKWNEAGCKLYESKGYKVYEYSKIKLKYTKDLDFM